MTAPGRIPRLGLGTDPTPERVADVAEMIERVEEFLPEPWPEVCAVGSRALGELHATRCRRWEGWELREGAEMFLWPSRLRPWPPTPLQLAVHEAERERAWDHHQRDRHLPMAPRLEWPASAWSEWLAEWDAL